MEKSGSRELTFAREGKKSCTQLSYSGWSLSRDCVTRSVMRILDSYRIPPGLSLGTFPSFDFNLKASRANFNNLFFTFCVYFCPLIIGDENVFARGLISSLVISKYLWLNVSQHESRRRVLCSRLRVFSTPRHHNTGSRSSFSSLSLPIKKGLELRECLKRNPRREARTPEEREEKVSGGVVCEISPKKTLFGCRLVCV